MTLITVVCYDFVIFNRSKSHAFEKSTVLSCGYFSEIPSQNTNSIFLFRPFYVRLKTLRRKNNLSDFCGNERSFVGKNPTAANFDGNLINRPICKFLPCRALFTRDFRHLFMDKYRLN